VALAPELISSSATAMDELFVTLCFLISNLKPHALCCDEDDPKRSKVPNRVILNPAECGMFPFIEWPGRAPAPLGPRQDTARPCLSLAFEADTRRRLGRPR
jgi:hypothetical protein